MKPKVTLRYSLLLVGSSLLAIPHSHAASGTWNVNANGLWSTSGNWTPGIADGSGFTANFTNDITADRTVSLDSDRTLTSLVFGDSATGTAGSWILNNNGDSNNNLILAGTTPGITVNALGTGKTATISAIIEGTAGLVKSGSGTLILSGPNTYTGGTSINGGTLIASHISALGGGTVTMAANTVLRFGVSGTFANNISMGSGSTLAPNQDINPITYSGTITANGTNSGTSGVAIPTTAIAFSAFSGGDTQTFDNAIGGTGDVAFRGGGAAANHNHIYVLKGSASAYTGNTWLYPSSNQPVASPAANVVLQLQGGALPSTTVLTMTQNNTNVSNNSVLDLNGNSQTLAGLTTFTLGTGGRGFFVSNTHASAASTLTINNAGNFTFAGVIGVNSTTAATGQTAGAGNIALIKSGAGTQTLSGANTYTGGTTLNQGTLTVGTGGTLGATTGALSVNNTNTGTATAAILNLATAVDTTTGSLSGTIATATPDSPANTATINTQSTLTFTVNQTAPGSYAGVIAGAGNFALGNLSTNTLTLTGTNTYTGTTTVSAGTLQFNGLLSGAGGTVGVSGGTLGVGASSTIPRNVNLSSGAVNLAGTVAGTLSVTGGTVTTSGTTPTVTTADFSAGSGTVNAGTPLAITSTLKMGSTTATLTGGTSFTAQGDNLANNSTARTLTLSGGTLTLNGVNAGTGGTINLVGGNVIHTFTNTGASSLVMPTGVSATANVLVVGGGGGGGGNGGGGGGAGGLLSNGSFSLGSGSTTSVTVGAGGVGGNPSGANGNGTNSAFGTLIAIGGGGGGTRDSDKPGHTGGSGGGGGAADGGAGTSGAGTVGQGSNGGTGFGNGTTSSAGAGGGGAGGVGTNGASNLGGLGGIGVANSISGSSVFYAGGGGGGTTGAGNGSAGGNGGGGTGAKVGLNATNGVANTGGGGGGGGSISGSGGSGIVIVSYLADTNFNVNFPVTSIAATASSLLDLGFNSGTHTLASLHLAAGGTTTALSLKNGATLTLNGDASNNAISATGSPGQTASTVPGTSAPSLIIGSGKNISVDTGVTLDLQSAISGGAVTKIGTGTLNLSGTNTYTGATVISGGSLQIGAGGTTGSLTGTASITNNANLTINRSDDFTQAAGLNNKVISGTGSFTQAGAGTTTLTAANTYTGGTNVNAGTLAVNGALADTAVTVGTGARLQGTGSIVGSVSIQGGGTLATGNSIESLATGALTLGSNSTFAYEIDNDAVPSLAGDLTAVTGNLTLDLGNTSVLTIAELGSGSWTAGEKLTLISYSGTWNGGLFTYLGNTLSNNGTFNLSGADWLFKYDDTTPGTNFVPDLTGPSYVTMVAVPEPTTMALLGVGVALLGLRVARRNRDA